MNHDRNKHGGRPRWGVSLLAVFGLIVAAGVWSLGHDRVGVESVANARGSRDDPRDDYIIPNVFADLAEQTLPSVVAVYVKQNVRKERSELRKQIEQFRPFWEDKGPDIRRFFEQLPEQDDPNNPHDDDRFETRASGSGVIISKDGYIVTNNHIVAGIDGGRITVVLNDDTEISHEKVKIVATDSLLDLAVLKIDPKGLDLKPLKWGDSEAVRIGEWVMVIGNPLDLRGSVSKGIVSAKLRKIGKVAIEHLIQTDAMINPGNSGGAMVNLKGELIGINMAIATNTGFFQGIGFAIPSKDARFITDQVVKYGRVRRGYIGIAMDPLTNEALRSSLGLSEDQDGVLVTAVVDGAPADNAGVRPYDIITEVDELEVHDNLELISAIAGKAVGDKAELTILREVDGDLKQVQVTMRVVERPSDEELTVPSSRPQRSFPKKEKKKDPKRDLGFTIRPYDEDDLQGLEIVTVTPGSAAARGGMAPGDIILEVNRAQVRSLEDFEEALDKVKKDRPHLIRFHSQRGGRELLRAIPTD